MASAERALRRALAGGETRRRTQRALAAIPLLAALACAEAYQGPPDVLLVTLDTTRADHFGSYGHPGGLTPRMDAVAAEGTLFERARASSAATPISHASILTGLNPYRHGLRVMSAASGFRLDAGIPTLATLLRERGYTTAAVHGSFTVSRSFGLDSGFDHFDDVAAQMEPVDGGEFVDWNVAAFQRRADETSDRVLDLLDDLPEPFLLWIHYWDPHDPYELPPDGFLRPGVREQPRPEDALYAEEIRYVDQQLGRVLDRLAELGRLDRTLVAVTADHGQGLADGLAGHGWRGHRMLYRQQIDVPLILRGPGVPAGRRVSGVARTIDLLPTLLDLLDLPAPPGLEGASLRAPIEGAPDPHAPRMAYADQLNGYDWNALILRQVPSADFLYSVSDGTWKLIYRPSRPEASELFNLEVDPEERTNVLSWHPDQVRRLLVDLARRHPFVDRPFPGQGDSLSPEERRALASLGYLEDPVGREREAPRWGWRCPEGGPVLPEPTDCAASGAPTVLVALPASQPTE